MSSREAIGFRVAIPRTGAYAPVAAPPASRSELAIEALTVRYGSGPVVFSGVDFSIGRGEQVALIGANGAGKSTLLKCCLGFVRPESGKITLFEHSIGDSRGKGERRLRGEIGFVAQKHNLVDRMSVLSNVVHGMLAARPGPRSWLQCLAPQSVRSRAMDALALVGLADLAMRRADLLSGGQSQRVAIARALVSRPRLLLADEPAASLDPAAGEEVMSTFTRVSRETGTTLIFTTHNLEHALNHAGRVIGLQNGGLHLDARTAELAARDLHGLYD